MVARVASKLDIFRIVVECGPRTTLGEIVTATKADRLLLQRILRFLTGYKMLDEEGNDLYRPNKVTRILATAGQAGQLTTMYAKNPPPVIVADE